MKVNAAITPWNCCARSSVFGICRPTRSLRLKRVSTQPRVRRCSRSKAATRPAAGPNGRRAFSTARRSCSSTPPATPRSWRSAAAARVDAMAPHVSHVGVHDHGFNNVSTYGNLLRLMNEGRIADRPVGAALLRTGPEAQRRGAGPALDEHRRRRRLHLFLQRAALAVRRHDPLAARAGRRPSARPRADGGERPQGLAAGSAERARRRPRRPTRSTTARAATPTTCAGAWRTRRSSTSNDGGFRCPNSQQGYSPFSTWTRGLAWAMCGFAEQLEFLADCRCRRRARSIAASTCLKAARATCDFYIDQATAADGIPYWDTGAPNLHRLGDWQIAPGRSVQSARAGRQFGGGHRRARAAAAGPLPERARGAATGRRG